jgi:UDP-N-acetylmuramoyl-tripeptide--D-alanyl-D-alanine ligase
MMDIDDIYRLLGERPQVVTDTREDVSGAVFVALRGDRFDGNRFVGQALEAGCALAITDDVQWATDSRVVVTDNTLLTLQALARRHRMQLGTPVIAVTGTNGKTTTKELMAAVLAARYRILRTEGNLNNHIGVPLTLLRLRPEHEVAVVEMGANHPGEIRALADIALPDYGIVTNVGMAHLEGFGSLEGVMRTKGELYDHLRATGGVAFVPRNDERLCALSTGLDRVFYGPGDDSFIDGEVTALSPFVQLTWRCAEGRFLIDTQLIGAYNRDNVLAAIAAGKFFGIEPGDICAAIAAYRPQNNRSQLLTTARNRLIVDAYNANPTSMAAALANFRDMAVSPKAVVLGDMKELGDASVAAHRQIVELIACSAFDRVFLCGSQFCAAAVGRFPAFPDTGALVEALREERLEGYCILIKGSREMMLERTIEAL